MMKWNLIFLILTNICTVFSYNSFFYSWHCIGVRNNINFLKPYTVNIGELPLVVWKDRNDKLVSTVNICKHMGSKLDNAKITNTGCLKCQYHGMEFSNLDKFGETIEQDGKIFWAYNPESKKPESIPFYNNKNYVSSIIEIDMPCSLSDSAYNTLDMRHPEFVHSLGFGSSAAPTNIKQYQFSGIRKSPGPYYYNDKRIGLSFDYSANEIMRKINNNAKNTNNFHMFVYPSFSWSRVTFQKKNLIIGVNFLPLSPNKTRWYVTICHNYSKSSTGQEFIKLLASTILSQDYIQMKNQYQDNELKKAIMFEKVFSDEEAILWLKELFNDYKYPDVQMCTELYKNYKQ